MQEKITTNDVFISRLIVVTVNLNMSQSEFGRRCNISQSAISAYMKGKRNPGADELGRMATVAGVSMDWLWGLTDEDEKPDEKIIRINRLHKNIDLAKKNLYDALKALEEK